MKRTLVQLGLVAAIISTLAGCGGGGGSDGAPGATGATGATGAAATATGVTVPVGSAVAQTSTTVAFASNSTPATSESTAAWKALAPTVSVTSVSIQSPPVVKFTVTDANGKAVIGLGSKSQSSSAMVASYANIGFTLAKLVPGTNGAPSKWVSYNILKPGTVAQRAAGYTQSAIESCTPDFKWCGTFPAADKEGTLIDNGDGSYQYTFYRDPKLAKDLAATLVDSSNGLLKKADLGDLTFDATATHRLGILVSGNAPGSGTNTPTAVASNAAPTAVAMVTPGNQWFDFRPDGGTVTTTRQVVNISSCASCHDGKVIGHSDRRDPNLCVTCHTDQIRYSFSKEAPRTGLVLTSNASTVSGEAASVSQLKRADQAVIYNRAVGDYPSMIHKVHMGDELTLTGYNFNAAAAAEAAMAFNANGFPQDRRNCTKCHNGDTQTNPLQAVKTTDGNNWKNVPSRLACGACHDGIDFATGLGTTAAGATTGHGLNGVGGAQANDSACVTCHTAAAVALSHRTNVPTANNATVAAGVATFSYEISSVTIVNSQPVVKFRILKDGVAVTLNTPALVTHATSGQQVVSPAFEPVTGFAGGPSFYVAFSVPQDGITSPIDFHLPLSGSGISSLTNALIPAGSPKQGITTGPDASGYYTTTLTGDTLGQAKGTCSAPVAPATATCVVTAVTAAPFVLPASAKMVTVALMGSFTQKTGFETGSVAGATQAAYVAANVSTNPVTSTSGGLTIKAMLAKMAATGQTARRVIVDVSKCNSCHDRLGGTVVTFHGGARNDPTVCNFCHNGNRTSNGWAANSSTFIHGVHGKSKRSVLYSWAAVSTATTAVPTAPYSFTTPGVLQDCAQCHVPNSVNYGTLGATPSATSLIWTTAATGSFANPATGTSIYRNSPYITLGTNYGNGFSFTPAGATVGAYTNAAGTTTAAHVAAAGGETVQADPATLVSSPISAACFSCHDTTTAKGHMTLYGGFIYTARSVVGAANLANNPETCLICHGAGKVNDAAVIHHK